jgi:hypothetical protein
LRRKIQIILGCRIICYVRLEFHVSKIPLPVSSSWPG